MKKINKLQKSHFNNPIVLVCVVLSDGSELSSYPTGGVSGIDASGVASYLE